MRFRRAPCTIADRYMTQIIEISLRIPSLRVRREGKDTAETISNSDVRFSKQLEVEAIPKPGDVLPMTDSSGRTFPCEVVRGDWQQDKEMFVIACRYSQRSISPADYQSLMSSTDWKMRPLL
jgi:hypothetical protein